MSLPRLELEVRLGGFAVSADFSVEPLLSPALAALDRLNERVYRRHASDVEPVLLQVRTACPECGAGPVHLTAIVHQGVYMRACRSCRSLFDVE